MARNGKIATAAGTEGNDQFKPPSLLPVLKGEGAMPEAGAAFREEAKGQVMEETFGLPVIRIDHRQERFTMPDGTLAETVDGYAVHKFQRRAWWDKGFTPGSSEPPKCWSDNMIVPDAASEQIAERCDICPHSQWGSDAIGKGQACKTSLFVFLVNPTWLPPLACLIVPASSLKAFEGTSGGFSGNAGYFRKAESRAGAYQVVWMTARLERAGDLHCVVVPEVKAIASTNEARAIAKLRGSQQKSMETLRSNVGLLIEDNRETG